MIQNKEEAIRETGLAAAALTMCLYPGASVGPKLAAIAAVQKIGLQTRVVRLEVIGWAKTCLVLAAELAAIAMALDYACNNLRQTQIIVFSDSQQALQAIQCGNAPVSKRALLHRIMEAMAGLTSAKPDIGSDGHQDMRGS